MLRKFAHSSFAFALFLSLQLALAQTTISTGSIQGTITDPSSAVVSGARITITNKSTAQSVSVTSTSSGSYASGALLPGQYTVRIEAKGFKTVELPVTVQVNTTSSGNVRMTLGQGNEVIEVAAESLGVNTEQATVQGVLTSQQIETLPINGRNFLDLAQLEPGVQIQDGGTFDPTKNGFSSISFGGRFGRTARIEVDGLDISDETVGTTTANIPLGAIQESALQQSSLDLSTELTSSGSVNVTTKSGTNGYHGQAFYYFRDQSLDANLPGGTHNPFQRNQFGGSFGGPILKDRLFFFIDAERNKQDLLDPVVPGGPFAGLIGSFNSPFRETQAIGRLDWQVRNYKIFYRFSFDQNTSVLPFIPNSFQPFANVNHTPDHAVGVDFNTGGFTHSIRFGYTKFRNGITDAVTGSSIFNPAPGIELAIGADPNCLTAGVNVFCSGPNFLAPQATIQSNHQVKYDGSKAFGSHVLRYGFGFNHILGGGFAKFLGTAPAVGAPTNSCDATCQARPGGASNPLNYPVVNVTLGNGQGFSSEKATFGFPAGGLGPDNRISWYIGDSWKARPNLTITAGLRYVRDTGRTDSDIGPINALTQFNNQFYSGLQNRVRQPNLNFAPQLGVAWDPKNNGKTVIRAGIGLFYENSIWNNNLFNRPARLPQGLFLAEQPACAGPFTLPDGTPENPTFCGQAIGDVFPQIVALQQQYQAATVAAGPAVNQVYIGNILSDGIDVTGTNLFLPNYITPRSVQMNVGIQREIRRGTVFTADYLRNVATHNLLSIDTNHVGDSRYFDMNAALTAISTTNAAFGCGGGTSSSAIQCAIGNGALMLDYAGNGLDSAYQLCGGLPCPLIGAPAAAFPGINPNIGTNQMLSPVGRSVYSGLQLSLRQDLHAPFRGIKGMNLQVSYAFSRYVATARDSDFINFPTDNANPTRYIGPDGLDRTHQLSFGGTLDLPANFRISVISHFYSPLPANLTLPVSGNAGGIFVTDLTGDGTGDGSIGSNGGLGDLLPGTNVGSFGRDVSVGKLSQLISTYNSTNAGQATPAGQVLIANGLFSLAQLQQLGGVQQAIPPVVQGAVGQDWLRAFDLSFSWAFKRENFELRPGVSFFNLFNFANFDGPAAPFSSVLDGTAGSPNGTTNPQPAANRLGLGSGVFGVGSPRVIEFTLKLNF